MLSSLVATKLFIPPLRSDHISRPRLVDYLDTGYRAGKRLTLVSAPAGYGKTSLISEWYTRLVGHQIPLAWLALEENDNDVLQFMQYLLAALRQVSPKIGQEFQDILERPQPPAPLEIVTGVINDIAAMGSPLVLALDDYHLVTNPAVHEVMNFLIDRAPANLHIVVSSRHDPLLPLPRLRARGQVTEIRLKDLRFRTEEAAEFLRNSMGLDLPVQELAALQERTEGWAAGLQLAAISLADGETASNQFIESFTGDNRHILDYLLEEVLVRQLPEVQRFLLETSVLDKFCVALCDAVLQEEEPQPGLANGSQKIIDYLDRANLFLIPLDSHREWFRYHHLFSEALRYRLQRQKPGQAIVLHRRAAVWFDQNRLPVPAFDHAMSVRDIPLAADIAERWLDQIIFDGQIYQAQAWLRALPEAVVNARPEILFRKVRMHGMRGETDLALETLDRLQACLERITEPFPRQPHLWCLVYCERARFMQALGRLDEAEANMEQALKWLPPDDRGLYALTMDVDGLIQRHLGNLERAESGPMVMYRISLDYKSYLGVVSGLVEAMRAIQYQGQSRRALQLAQDFLDEHLDEVKHLPVVGIVYSWMGEVSYDLNRLAEAEAWLEQARETIHRGGIADDHGHMHNRLALVKWLTGKPDEVEPALQDAENWYRKSNSERGRMESRAIRMRLRLIQGNLQEGAQFAAQYAPVSERPYRQDCQDNTLAWVWLAQGNTLDALHYLEVRQPGLETKKINLFLIENLALQALCLQRLGSQAEALEKIQRALRLAEPEGLERIFLDLGFEMALLLSRLSPSLSPGDPLSSFTNRLLAGFPEKDRGNLPAASPVPASKTAGTAEEWLEGLSEREVEVLRWMARGLGNMQIAEQMVVAESTVKKHINHIFGKLGVENRTQALIKARERGLL